MARATVKQRKLSPEQAAASVLGASPERRPITHLSYSSRTKYSECAKAYELTYITGAPRKGAVWFVGGKAVHRATELYDLAEYRGESIDLPTVWHKVFMEELESSRAQDPEEGAWRKAGVTKDNPAGEDVGAWSSRIGPQQVESYIAWRKRTPFRLWETPDGQPAIELDVSCQLPGMELELKAYIDRIFINRLSGQPIVVDIKTGSRKPDSPLQFGVYAAAVAQCHGIQVQEGAAMMTRRGILTEPWELDKYTPAYVGRHFAQLYGAVQAGYFAPKVGHHCNLCDVSASCFAQDGPLAAQYDPDAAGPAPF